MKEIYINYSKPLLRGGNCKTKKDLDEKLKELKEDGWAVEFGKYGIGENEYFKYWYEATKMEKIEEDECPRCKSKNSIPISYGYPTAKTLKEEKQGKVFLGGCEVTGNDPNRHCKDCLNIFFERSVA